ncbi:4Fe-4S ferredoxin [Thermodesulfobacteriota bacterium]
MLEEIKGHVKALFDDGKISAFLGLKDLDGNVVPHLFEKPEEIENGFTLGAREEGPPDRYPLAKLLLTLVSNYSDQTFGILLRGCDERALNELVRWNQIAGVDERIIRVGFACKQELAQAHECRKPFPDSLVAGDKAEAVESAKVNEVNAKDLNGRLEFWLGEFERCIKCYGCRNVCPVCFCNVCSLEEDSLIPTGEMPPENPMFHLTRAVHMAGRCVDCNMCSEACPADIPLRTLYKKVAQIVKDEFGYVTGEAGDGKSPLNLLGGEPGHTSADE